MLAKILIDQLYQRMLRLAYWLYERGLRKLGRWVWLAAKKLNIFC